MTLGRPLPVYLFLLPMAFGGGCLRTLDYANADHVIGEGGAWVFPVPPLSRYLAGGPGMPGDHEWSPRRAETRSSDLGGHSSGMPGAWGRRFGMRGGFLSPLGETGDDYDAAAVFGPYYAGEIGRYPFEAGLDVAQVESADGRLDALLYLFRFDCLFSRWNTTRPTPSIYGMGGFEVITSDAYGGESATGINLGVGLTSLERRWDARLTLSVLLGSGNIRELLLISGGYRF